MNELVQNNDEFISPYCHVQYVANDNVVLLTWKEFCCFDNYRKPTIFAAELLIQKDISNFIVDARNGFEDDKADIEWGFSILLPKMAQSKCKYCIFIVNEVTDIEGEIDLWTEEFMKYFVVKKVNSYVDAINFIQGF